MNAKELLGFLLNLEKRHNLEEVDVRCWDRYEDVIEQKSSIEFDEESVILY